MLKGTPAFPVRCKVRLSPITRKPARVKTFMPKRISLVSTKSYSSAGSNPEASMPDARYRHALLAQVTPSDLDIAIVSELALPELPFGDGLKPCPL